MKKIIHAILILLIAAVMGLSLSACDIDGAASSPTEIIKDNYGTEQFKISFSSEGLAAPLDAVYYTAQKLPSLPTPERVGYIFEGWYFDSEFTNRYHDTYLYLYMKDLTLYAKWTKEEMTENGTYDIEFSAQIVEGSVTKGPLTDEYGGYKSFADDIIADETYIEKTDSSVMLKLRYDCGTTVPFGSLPVYTVTVASQSASKVYIEDSITSETESIKTIFFNIDNLNLEDTLYLSVSVTNWDTEGLSAAQRNLTAASYVVAFKITSFIGFGKPYIDTSNTIDDGYYLVKTYYRQQNNATTMMDAYNTVYSYIIAKDGQYKLVKPFTPYAGLIGSSGSILKPYTLNYYNRAMTFSQTVAAYAIDGGGERGKTKVESDYYPAAYNGAYYCDFSVEYHADTGKYYYVFDLGDSVEKSLMVVNAVTGFMEVASSMGYVNQILNIDYEHIIKVKDIDYTPLSGDACEYSAETQYYAGKLTDLNDRDLTKTATDNYSLYTQLINFYYSCEDTSLPDSLKKMYSHKITVTPLSSGSTVAEARYQIAHFYVNTKIYGYDLSENLYADSMTVDSLGGYGMRENIQIRTGKSLNYGTSVDLEEVYADKVNRFAEFGNVSYTAYEIVGESVDYEKIVALPQVFSLTKNVAVLFKSIQDDGAVSTALVELAVYSEPEIKIITTEENNYDPEAEYTVGDEILFPIINYSWMGASGGFIGNYFLNENGAMGVNVTKVATFGINAGAYTLQYYPLNTLSFKMSSSSMAVLYELTNVYGEVYHYYIYFNAEEKPAYSLKTDDEEVLSGTVTISDGERRVLDLYTVNYLSSADALLSKNYYLTVDGTTTQMQPVSYTLYLADSVVSNGISDIEETLREIKSYLKNQGYAYLILTYKTGNDVYSDKYLCLTNFSGKTDTVMFEQQDYFTDYDYSFSIPNIFGADGLKIGTVSVSAYAMKGDNIETQNSNLYFTASVVDKTYNINFNLAGRYQIRYFCHIKFDSNMDYVFPDGTSVSFTLIQYITVYDGSEVSITYITDDAHPFNNGQLKKTVVYNLKSDTVISLSKNNFESTADMLFAWTCKQYYKPTDSVFLSGTAINDFIGSFNAKDVTLYAYWDAGAIITADMNTELTGQENISKLYYLQTDLYKGKYSVNLSDFEITNIPSGYTFIGWTGGFLGDEIVYIDSTEYKYSYSVSGSSTITAVIKKQYKITYSIDAAMSNTYFVKDTVLDGGIIPEKSPVICKVEGYEFKYWVIVGTSEPFDLSTPVTNDITLVAVFGLKE